MTAGFSAQDRRDGARGYVGRHRAPRQRTTVSSRLETIVTRLLGPPTGSRT